jgi:hypothetical protein
MPKTSFRKNSGALGLVAWTSYSCKENIKTALYFSLLDKFSVLEEDKPVDSQFKLLRYLL